MDLGFQFGIEDVSSTIAYVGALWTSFHQLILLIVGVALGLLVLGSFNIFRQR
jgi:hypothetical protein